MTLFWSKITQKMNRHRFGTIVLTVEARSLYAVAIFSLPDLSPPWKPMVFLGRTHIFKESRKGQNTDSGLVFDLILGSVLVIGGPCCAFLLLVASFGRCSKKVKMKHGYNHD